ncbi:hypothetical protein VPHD479_0049 [Vibrio phage D479]
MILDFMIFPSSCDSVVAMGINIKKVNREGNSGIQKKRQKALFLFQQQPLGSLYCYLMRGVVVYFDEIVLQQPINRFQIFFGGVILFPLLETRILRYPIHCFLNVLWAIGPFATYAP